MPEKRQLLFAFKFWGSHHGQAKGKEGLVECVEGCSGILDSASALQPRPVEANVPICEVGDEV